MHHGIVGDERREDAAEPHPLVAEGRTGPVLALGRSRGPAAGLALLDQLEDVPALRGYHLVPSVRGDLYERSGRGVDAAEQFERAAAMTANERERALLLGRAAAARAAAGDRAAAAD